MLAPLRRRDFRLLWTGMAVSLLGDGMFHRRRGLAGLCHFGPPVGPRL